MSLSLEGIITKKLKDAFHPKKFEIINESYLHVGHPHHGNYNPAREKESHFFVKIASPVFADMTRLERHRAVYAVLRDELVGDIHSVRLEIEVD